MKGRVMPQKTARSRAVDTVSRDVELQNLVEELGVWFERLGWPRMAGRVIGWLLVCDPPEQTMQELAEQLHASMGSVSTMTRMLGQVGVIERVSLPGSRRVRFRVCPSAWTRSVEEQLERTRSLHEIAERGLALLSDSDPARQTRLKIMRTYTRFYLDELPRLIALWNEISGTYSLP